MDPTILGEFFGTMILILLGNGVVGGVLLAGSKAENAGWIAITTGWALAVFCGISVAFAMGDSAAHLNPAVTLAAVILNGHPEHLVTYIPAQILGAMAGATLVWLFYLPHWAITPDGGKKLACFCTGPAIRGFAHNAFCEALGTFVLVLVANSFGAPGFAPHGAAAGLAPVLVGAVVWSVGLSLGATTGYAINPARDFGPRLMHAILPVAGKSDSDWSYSPVPILGPAAGAALAAIVIRLTGI